MKELIKFIEVNNLELIPLIQTFGHAEFILKIQEFSHLRELVDEPQSFCPSKNGTISLIEEMIRQVKISRKAKFLGAEESNLYLQILDC